MGLFLCQGSKLVLSFSNKCLSPPGIKSLKDFLCFQVPVSGGEGRCHKYDLDVTGCLGACRQVCTPGAADGGCPGSTLGMEMEKTDISLLNFTIQRVLQSKTSFLRLDDLSS